MLSSSSSAAEAAAAVANAEEDETKKEGGENVDIRDVAGRLDAERRREQRERRERERERERGGGGGGRNDHDHAERQHRGDHDRGKSGGGGVKWDGRPYKRGSVPTPLAPPSSPNVTTHAEEEGEEDDGAYPISKISVAVQEFSKAVPNLLPADVKLGFNRLSPPDQIALVATADAVSCLIVLENLPDERGAALMLAVGSKRAAEVMSELSNLRLLKLIRHIIKVDDGTKASHIVSRLAQKQGSTPYLVWLDQDDVGNMLVKLPPVEAAQMVEGLSGARCGEILDKIGARNRWNAGKILSAMNRPKAAAVLSSMTAEKRDFMLASMDHYAASLVKVRMDSSLVSNIMTNLERNGKLEGVAGEAAADSVKTWTLEKGVTTVKETRDVSGRAHKAHEAARMAEIVKAGERRNKINKLISQAAGGVE